MAGEWYETDATFGMDDIEVWKTQDILLKKKDLVPAF